MTEPEHGYYAYAVSTADALCRAAGTLPVTGIDEQPVLTVGTDRLSALVSVLDLAPLRALREAADATAGGWLERAAAAHERVALLALDTGPMLPLRFGTVYPDRAALCTALAEHADRLIAECRRLAGSTEWNVRITGPPSTSTAHVEAPVPAGPAPGPGTAWLRARQARLYAAEAAAGRLASLVDELRGTLRPAALDEAYSPAAGGLAPRLAYLVGDVGAFRAAFDAAPVRDDLEVRLTGPWPPYHFVRTAGLDGTDG